MNNKENFSTDNNFGVQMFEFSDSKSNPQPALGISDKSFYCSICSLELNSQVVFEQHLKGQKHLKKAGANVEANNKSKGEEEKMLKCELCQVSVIGKSQFEAHLTGKKHLKKSGEKVEKKMAVLVEQKKFVEKIEPVAVEELRCEICDLNLATKDQLAIHLAGKKHLKKLSSLSTVAAVSTKKQKANQADDEQKFSHLNIAWDKYKIIDEKRSSNGEKFEFYCALCNKYMQRKMQLVDHLKSKKHHRKIYEKRAKDNTNSPSGSLTGNETPEFPRKQFFPKKPKTPQNQQNFKKPIKFVTSTNTNNNEVIKNFPNFSTGQKKVDTSGAFDQPITSTAYPLMSYYQNQKNLQPNYNANKRKSSGGLSNISNMGDEYESTNAKMLKSNNAPMSSTNQQNMNFANNPLQYSYGSYNSFNPMLKNQWANPPSYSYQQQQQQPTQQPQTSTPQIKEQSSDMQNFTYNMFSNLAYMQYAAYSNTNNNNNGGGGGGAKNANR